MTFFWLTRYPSVVAMEDFLSRSLELLELEREAEELQAQAAVSSQLLGNPKLLESRGLCIQKLQVWGSTGKEGGGGGGG